MCDEAQDGVGRTTWRVGSVHLDGKAHAQEAKGGRDGRRGPSLAGEGPRRSDRPTLEDALEALMGTEVGRHLKELRNGPHHDERAQEWQESLARERTEERADVLG